MYFIWAFPKVRYRMIDPEEQDYKDHLEDIKRNSCTNHPGVGVMYCQLCITEQIEKLREEFRIERDKLRKRIYELEHPNSSFNSTQFGSI